MSTTPVCDGRQLLGWGTVRAALALTFFGGLLFVLSGALLAVIVATTDRQNVLVQVVSVLSLFGHAASLTLIYAGVCMTTAAPRASGARGWGMLATAFATAFVVLSVILGLSGLHSLARNITIDPEQLPRAPTFTDQELAVMGLAWMAVLGLGIACYLLSLRAMAASFRQTGVALSVVCFLLFVVVGFVGFNVVVYQQVQQLGPNLDELRSRAELMGTMVLGGLTVLGLWGLATTAMVRAGIGRGMVQRD